MHPRWIFANNKLFRTPICHNLEVRWQKLFANANGEMKIGHLIYLKQIVATVIGIFLENFQKLPNSQKLPTLSQVLTFKKLGDIPQINLQTNPFILSFSSLLY